MVILGNLPSQLRVLDSFQQLYASLFLAPYCSSTPTLSLQTLRKTLSPTMSSQAFSFLSFFFSPFSVSRICLPNDLYRSHLFLPPFLLQPHFLLQPPFLSHFFCSRLTACGTPPQKVPPRVKALLQLQKARLIPYGH